MGADCLFQDEEDKIGYIHACPREKEKLNGGARLESSPPPSAEKVQGALPCQKKGAGGRL